MLSRDNTYHVTLQTSSFRTITSFYFSVNGIDWRKLKQRLKKEGNETVTTCHALKMLSVDGKMRLTDVADQEQMFRLIQSIPSPKEGGSVAKAARKQLESKTGKSAISSSKASDYLLPPTEKATGLTAEEIEKL